jgi:putative salt-induced outer membrane protein
MHRSILLAVVLFLANLGNAWAEEEAPAGPWSGKLGIGFLSITGNVESQTTNAEGELRYDAEKWHHSLFGRAVGSSQEGESTAEAYKLTYTANYDFTDRTYAFGLLDWNKDRFGAFVEQSFQLAGLGRRFIVSDKHLLNGEIGFGLGQNERANGTTEDEFTTRISGDYTWNISENAQFGQRVAINIGASNTFLESVTELRATVAGPLSLGLSYTIKNNSDVAPDTKKTDTWLAINLNYAFGKQ